MVLHSMAHVSSTIRLLSVRSKIFSLVTLLIAVISVFIYLYFPATLERQAITAISHKAEVICQITAFNLGPALLFHDTTTVNEILMAAREDDDVVYVVVRDTMGRVLAAIDEPAAVAARYTDAARGQPLTEDRRFYRAYTPIADRNATFGELYLGISLVHVADDVRSTRNTVAVVSVLIFLLGVVAVFTVSTLIIKPLESMVGTVEAITAGDLSKRAPVYSMDEIGHLASSFNIMVERLERAHHELEAMNRMLEQRISDRTRALQQEIHEGKRKESALRESEERYRRFFEEDLTGDYIMTTEGVLVACNPAFAHILGFNSVEDALRSGADSIFPDPSIRHNIVAMVRREGKLEYREEILIRRDGAPIHVVENIVGEFDEHRELVALRGYLFDDTRRKMLETQLIQAQKMETIGTLAGGIAHDFNNLLGIILGYAHRMRNTREHEQIHKKSVDSIIAACERGASVVRQLLTFARKTDVHVESVRVQDLLQELLTFLRDTLPRTIDFNLDVQADLPPVSADPNQLHQALLNLCLNSRDAMPNGGTVTLSAKIVTASDIKRIAPTSAESTYLCLGVHDPGIGMDTTTQQRMFEPFFSTKGRDKGTGLGLAVVYGVVNSHHGFLHVDSTVGEGTTIRMYLPIPSGMRQDPAPAQEVGREYLRGTETILIVEDELMLQELLRALLEGQGYTVLTASDGAEAVEVFTANKDRIALVLSDMGLPKLGGWEAFEQMRAVKPDLKAILASGYFDIELKAEILRAGARDFIQKPYVPDRILAQVRKTIDGQA
jgi:two-component system cell cycle sensor histidine kinase/response regulator CckA